MMLRVITSTKAHARLAATIRSAKFSINCVNKNATTRLVQSQLSNRTISNHLTTKRSFCAVPTEDNPDYCGPEGNRLRAEAQKFAEERHILMSEASKLFEAGDKAKAKELSVQGKVAGEKMEEANAKAAAVILDHRNGGHPDNYLDLHGLYLEEALTAFRERLASLQTGNGSDEIVFEVIPGAGNHSKTKAIIKPKVIEELQALNLYFEEKNAGSLLVYVNNGDGNTTTTTAPSSVETQDTKAEKTTGKSGQKESSGGSGSGSGSESNSQSGFGMGGFAALLMAGAAGSLAAYSVLAPDGVEEVKTLFKRLEKTIKDITGQ